MAEVEKQKTQDHDTYKPQEPVHVLNTASFTVL